MMALLSALGLLALAAFVPIPDQLTASPIVRRGFDALHLPLFALAAGAVLGFVLSFRSANESSTDEGKRKWRVAAILVAACFVGIAALVELVQPSTGRSGSFADFFHGAMGAVLGSWWIWRRNLWKLRERGGFWFIASAAVLAVGWPVFMAGQHSQQLEKSFPQLLVGDARVDSEFWYAEGGAEIEFLPADSSAEREFGLRVDTRAMAWSGVNFRPTKSAADWSSRSELVLQITCEGDVGLPFTLGLKIEDADSRDHATRYNHSLYLDEKSQTIRVALTEISADIVDLTRVTRLALFGSQDDPARSFIIDRAFLR